MADDRQRLAMGLRALARQSSAPVGMPMALTPQEQAGDMLAPAEMPDVARLVRGLRAASQAAGGPLLGRMQERGERQQARLATGERSPSPVTGEDVDIADALAGGMMGSIQGVRRLDQGLRAMTRQMTVDDVADWAKQAQSRFGLQSFDVHLQSGGDLKLNMLEVPKDARKTGIGTKAMEELTQMADKQGRRIKLTPGLSDDVHGTTSRARLVRFYKRFGFVENKGRNKDFSISEGMYREPKAAVAP